MLLLIARIYAYFDARSKYTHLIFLFFCEFFSGKSLIKTASSGCVRIDPTAKTWESGICFTRILCPSAKPFRELYVKPQPVLLFRRCVTGNKRSAREAFLEIYFVISVVGIILGKDLCCVFI